MEVIHPTGRTYMRNVGEYQLGTRLSEDRNIISTCIFTCYCVYLDVFVPDLEIPAVTFTTANECGIHEK